MRILVTGVSGYVGARARRRACGATATTSAASRARPSGSRPRAALDELVLGDALTGAGLDAALDGVDVAYYLIHSMEGAGGRRVRRRASAARPSAFAAAAARAGVRADRLPRRARAARTRRSRATSARGWRSSRRCSAAVPEGIALRASIVIGARSRSFRFLVRLIERLPVLALPAWRDNRTAPIDGRDVLEFLARAATAPAGRSPAGRGTSAART